MSNLSGQDVLSGYVQANSVTKMSRLACMDVRDQRSLAIPRREVIATNMLPTARATVSPLKMSCVVNCYM